MSESWLTAGTWQRMVDDQRQDIRDLARQLEDACRRAAYWETMADTDAAAEWDAGYNQAVRDHKMRSNEDSACDWPTSPNPHRAALADIEDDA